MNGTVFIVVLLGILIVVAIRMFMNRAAAQRVAHEARLKAMAQSYLVAAKKKQAADAAAAARAAAAAAENPVAPSTPMRDERDCPFCAEPILKKARVCKHCGRDVEPLA